LKATVLDRNLVAHKRIKNEIIDYSLTRSSLTFNARTDDLTRTIEDMFTDFELKQKLVTLGIPYAINPLFQFNVDPSVQLRSIIKFNRSGYRAYPWLNRHANTNARSVYASASLYDIPSDAPPLEMRYISGLNLKLLHPVLRTCIYKNDFSTMH
jgi:hypothetical protein